LCSASSLRAFNFVFEIIYPLQEFSSPRIDEALEERGIWGKTFIIAHLGKIIPQAEHDMPVVQAARPNF
jgi:hypothetical protein